MHCLRAGLRVVMLLRVRFTVILLMSEINARSSFFEKFLWLEGLEKEGE